MTTQELRSQLRIHGVADSSSVALVVLEPSGRVSVFEDTAKARAALDRLGGE
jgi:uncharacterized membrane protein YcaP (DUF421 family)